MNEIFKIRCSAIGQIMTNSRKKGELSKTTQSYVQLWLKEKIYARRKMIKSKYMDKGNMVEEASIDYLSGLLGLGELKKNESFFQGEYMTGTPDVIVNPDLLIDVKNSWDFSTFPLFDTEVSNKDYYWQAQGYMNLTGAKNYKLIYTLMNTPPELVEKEFRYSPAQDYDLFEMDYNYENVEDKCRVKVFNIERNDEDIEAINQRVIECREYIETLKGVSSGI